MGFARHGNAKRSLLRNFKESVDFEVRRAADFSNEITGLTEDLAPQAEIIMFTLTFGIYSTTARNPFRWNVKHYSPEPFPLVCKALQPGNLYHWNKQPTAGTFAVGINSLATCQTSFKGLLSHHSNRATFPLFQQRKLVCRTVLSN